MSTADFKLDARLRDVPVPDGLLDRLMALPLAGEEGVDELVRDVAVPAGLLQRLQAIALADDDGLDEALRNVPVPDDLVTSCHQHVRRYLARLEGRHPMDRALRIMRIAMAASLILAVTLSLGSAVLFTVVVDVLNRQMAANRPRDVEPTAPGHPGGTSPWKPPGACWPTIRPGLTSSLGLTRPSGNRAVFAAGCVHA